jgi:hypothetical protein
MRRVDTDDKLWHDGDPVTGTPGTVVVAEMMNAFQEELCAIIEKFGGVLNPADRSQLYKMLASRMLQKGGKDESVPGETPQYIDKDGVLVKPSGMIVDDSGEYYFILKNRNEKNPVEFSMSKAYGLTFNGIELAHYRVLHAGAQGIQYMDKIPAGGMRSYLNCRVTGNQIETDDQILQVTAFPNGKEPGVRCYGIGSIVERDIINYTIFNPFSEEVSLIGSADVVYITRSSY